MIDKITAIGPMNVNEFLIAKALLIDLGERIHPCIGTPDTIKPCFLNCDADGYWAVYSYSTNKAVTFEEFLDTFASTKYYRMFVPQEVKYKHLKGNPAEFNTLKVNFKTYKSIRMDNVISVKQEGSFLKIFHAKGAEWFPVDEIISARFYNGESPEEFIEC